MIFWETNCYNMVHGLPCLSLSIYTSRYRDKINPKSFLREIIPLGWWEIRKRIRKNNWFYINCIWVVLRRTLPILTLCYQIEPGPVRISPVLVSAVWGSHLVCRLGIHYHESAIQMEIAFVRRAKTTSIILIPQGTWTHLWQIPEICFNKVTMEWAAGSELLWGFCLPYQLLLSREITWFYFWCKHMAWCRSGWTEPSRTLLLMSN